MHLQVGKLGAIDGRRRATDVRRTRREGRAIWKKQEHIAQSWVKGSP